MPLPTSTNPTSFFESAAMPTSYEARKQEWEEPHPGRRLSCPHDRATTTWGVYAGDEGRRGSMAAEGLWPEYAQFTFALPTSNEKRLGRSRTRTVPPELVLANTGHARPEIHTAPLPKCGVLYPDSDDSGQELAAAAFEDSSREETPVETPEITSETSGTESDTDSFISGPARKRQALQPLNTSVQELPCTDFSNHLGIMDSESVGSFTVAEPEVAAAFSVMSPDSDLWGWNAVLERKDTQPSHETFDSYQQKRANRSKRSLLQRVFSPGGSSADELLSRSPTSFAGLEAQDR